MEGCLCKLSRVTTFIKPAGMTGRQPTAEIKISVLSLRHTAPGICLVTVLAEICFLFAAGVVLQTLALTLQKGCL